MQIRVLETILNSEADYFVVEFQRIFSVKFKQVTETSLVFVLLPNNLREIKSNRNMDTITVREMEVFKSAYIDQNFFIYPKYPPFQIGQQVFYDAVDCVP